MSSLEGTAVSSLSDMQPSRLYKLAVVAATFVLQPLLWLSPVFIKWDMADLEETHDVEFDTPLFVFYLASLFLSFLGVWYYLYKRKEAIRNSARVDGLLLQSRIVEMKSSGTSAVSLVYAGLAVFVFGWMVSFASSRAGLTIMVFGGVIGVAGVFLDMRDLSRRGIEWGRTQYLYVMALVFPLYLLFYIAHRKEKVFYTALSEVSSESTG